MAGRAVEQIGAVLPTVLRQTHQRQQLLALIQDRWQRIVGKRLAAHTRPASLRRGKLVVLVDHPGETFVLSYQRQRVTDRLRRATKGRVEDVVLRPGTVVDGVRH